MDVALEPGCPNRRAHPRWMQHRGHLRDAVVPGSRAQAPPANVTETYKSERRRTYRKKAYLGVTRRRYAPANYRSSRVKSGPLRGPIDPRQWISVTSDRQNPFGSLIHRRCRAPPNRPPKSPLPRPRVLAGPPRTSCSMSRTCPGRHSPPAVGALR